jgi:hypothetical protein
MVLDLRRSCSSDQNLGWQIYSLLQVNDHVKMALITTKCKSLRAPREQQRAATCQIRTSYMAFGSRRSSHTPRRKQELSYECQPGNGWRVIVPLTDFIRTSKSAMSFSDTSMTRAVSPAFSSRPMFLSSLAWSASFRKSATPPISAPAAAPRIVAAAPRGRPASAP